MNAMRRWEDMFTAQVSTQMQAVSELNSHISVLEDQIATQSREKQLLRERVEQAEMAQKELQVARMENETGFRQMMRDEHDKARRLQDEIKELHSALDQLSQQQSNIRVQDEKALDDIRNRQQRHRSMSDTLEDRMQGFESRLAEANGTIAALQEKEAQEARRHSKALADATETMAEVVSRVKVVEQRVVPDIKNYVDKSNDDYWAPSRAEIYGLKARVEELSNRIDQVDSSASSLVVSARDDAAKERQAARADGVALASANLSRFQLVDKALSEEKEARLKSEVKMRREVESMATAIADSIRDADAQHAGLVEAVHKRVMARIAQQGDVASVVQEALESKRAFLEEVVRAEIASRLKGMEELKDEIDAREAAVRKQLKEGQEEVQAQVKLLQVKIKANGRSIRNQTAAVEAARRVAEQVRHDLESEMLSVGKTQAQAEEQLRASFKAQASEMHLELSALREMVKGMGGLGEMTQEDRDLHQDEKIEKLAAGLAAASARMDSITDEQEHKRERMHKTLTELKGAHGLLEQSMSEKVAALGIAAEALRANFQSRLESTDQHVQDMRVQMIDVMKDLDEKPDALFQDAQKRIDECNKDLQDLRQSLEKRCRGVQEETSSTCQELSTQVETAQSRMALMQQQLRAEIARLDESDKAVRLLFDMHVRENKTWKEDTDERVQANHESAMRVRESFAGELRQIQAEIAEGQRGQDLKWQLLDSKLTDDTRKLLQAIQALNTAHESLKLSTDEHFAQVLAEEEKNLTRVWADIEANRTHCDKHMAELRARLGEEEHERREEDVVLRGALDTLRHDLEHKAKILDDELKHEASTRATADQQLHDLVEAQGEKSKAADHELDLKIDRLDDKTAGELLEVKRAAEQANEAHVARSSSNQLKIHEVEKAVDTLDEDYQGSKALLHELQEASSKEKDRVQRELGEVKRGVRSEHEGRQAAVTEVYRRMQVARELDMLMNNAAEAALLERIVQVREDVQQSGQAAESGMDKKVQRLSGMIRDLQQEDERLKVKVLEVEASAEKNHLELRQEDELMKKEVLDTKASVLLKASQMQDEVHAGSRKLHQDLEATTSKVSLEMEHIKGQVAADMDKLKADMAFEKEEREKDMSDKSAEWESALRKEKEEREKEMKAERAEQAAAVAAEKLERVAASDALSKRVDGLEAKEQELAEGAEKSGADAAEKLQALESKHAELVEMVTSNKAELESQIEGGSAKMADEVNAKVEEMGRKVDEIGGQVETLGAKTEDISSKVGGLESTMPELQKSVAEVEEGKADKAKVDSELHEVSMLRERVEKMEGTYVSTEKLEEELSGSNALLETEVKPQLEELRKKLADMEAAGVSDEAVEGLECIKQLASKLEAKAETSVADEIKTNIEELQTLLQARVVPLEDFVAKQLEAAEGADQGKEGTGVVGEERLKELQDAMQANADEAQKNMDFRFDNFKNAQDEMSKKIKGLEESQLELKEFANVNAQNYVQLETRLEDKVKQFTDEFGQKCVEIDQKFEGKIKTLADVVDDLVSADT